jgi:tRNA (guanine37-N1)-methyltransferase
MLVIKVPLEKAQEVKEFLTDANLFDKQYKVETDAICIYIPITEEFSTEYEIVNKDLERYEKEDPFKEKLKSILNNTELEKVKTAFDIVGDIAILEIDDFLRQKETQIAQALLESNKTIKTVVRKHGPHHGTFRTQDVIVLAGEDKKETTHKENNVKLKLDIEKVYYSPRLSTERKRITQQIKPNESILVMFSGNAPYVCVFAKNTQAKEVYGIEINPFGHLYGLENLKLNKLTNAQLFNGDVREIMPALNKKFDRIVMPLPKSYTEFLDMAFLCAKSGTIIHLYAFSEECKFDEVLTNTEALTNKLGWKFKLLEFIKCGQLAPKTYRICIDFEISK